MSACLPTGQSDTVTQSHEIGVRVCTDRLCSNKMVMIRKYIRRSISGKYFCCFESLDRELLLKHLSKGILRLYTTYLLDQASVTIEYDCLHSLSTNLPVTIKDADENAIIPLFSVRSGIDQIASHKGVYGL